MDYYYLSDVEIGARKVYGPYTAEFVEERLNDSVKPWKGTFHTLTPISTEIVTVSTTQIKVI